MAILLRGRLNIGSHITPIAVVVMGALAVACSAFDDDTAYLESGSELPLGHNVAIMAGSNCSTRTQIDPSDLQSVQWSDDDMIALWAMEESSSQFSFEAVPLALYYYGEEYNSAIFTGNAPEQTEGTYTYAATYPLPSSTSSTSVTLSLPAVQSGYYDGAADLMFGRVEGQAALTDDALRNGSLEFEQLTHAVRIEIPEYRDLLGTTTKLQVTFPEAVVGDATINITEQHPAITLSNSSNSVYVDFDQIISEAGYVWIFIAPTIMNGEIEFIGYDSNNIPSETITTTVTQREMAAGHITPITLTILEETYRSIVLTIDKNNLGEDITSMTLTAPSGAYFADDESEIVIEPDDDGYFRFSYKASLYESIFKAEGIVISYESKSAIVEGEPLMITDEHNLAENYIDCTVPYLFEEDFSLVASNSGDQDGTVTIDGYDIWSIGSHYQYWANTSVAIKAYDSSYTSTSFTNSILTLSGISAIKEGFSLTLEIYFDAGWTANQSTASMKLTVGDDSVTIDDNDLIPATDDIVLKITGSYIDSESSETTSYSYGPLSLSTYNTSQPMMIASADYNAQFWWGTAGTEGEAAPYFSGETDFEVIARGDTTEEVSLVLQNSIITVEFDEMFENYYSDALFTISTGSGNSFDFSAETTDKIVFVEASTNLTLSGSATKTRDGSSVTFNAAVIGQTTAQTLSRINITANSIGGENINITVDETITEMEPTQIELNPQGN